MTGPFSREAQQAGSLLHPLGCLCSISQGSLGTCKRLTKQSEELLHWEREENLGRQSPNPLPAPGEQRSLSKDKASSSSTNCCTEFNHWHSPMPSDNQLCSQVCKLLLFRRLATARFLWKPSLPPAPLHLETQIHPLCSHQSWQGSALPCQPSFQMSCP